ncbi:hypothetical protein HYV86_04905 [Candidatus Woesearchaeota archaeon]|nr:hypothetical protein [Candidatus Woesearchaeota archaeon]
MIKRSVSLVLLLLLVGSLFVPSVLAAVGDPTDPFTWVAHALGLSASNADNFLTLNWLVDIGLLDKPVIPQVGLVILVILGILGVAAYGISEKVGIPPGYAFIIAFAIVSLSWVLMPMNVIFVAATEYVTLFSTALVVLPFIMLGLLYWFFDEHPWVRAAIMVTIVVMWFWVRRTFGAASGDSAELAQFLEGTVFSGLTGAGLVILALVSIGSAFSTHAKGGIHEDHNIPAAFDKAKEGIGSLFKRRGINPLDKDAAAKAKAQGASDEEVEAIESAEEDLGEGEDREEKNLLNEYLEEVKMTKLLKEIYDLLSDENLAVFNPVERTGRVTYINFKPGNEYLKKLLDEVKKAHRAVDRGFFLSGRLTRSTARQEESAQQLLQKLLEDGAITQEIHDRAEVPLQEILRVHEELRQQLGGILTHIDKSKKWFEKAFKPRLGISTSPNKELSELIDELKYIRDNSLRDLATAEERANINIQGLVSILNGVKHSGGSA